YDRSRESPSVRHRSALRHDAFRHSGGLALFGDHHRRRALRRAYRYSHDRPLLDPCGGRLSRNLWLADLPLSANWPFAVGRLRRLEYGVVLTAVLFVAPSALGALLLGRAEVPGTLERTLA